MQGKNTVRGPNLDQAQARKRTLELARMRQGHVKVMAMQTSSLLMARSEKVFCGKWGIGRGLPCIFIVCLLSLSTVSWEKLMWAYSYEPVVSLKRDNRI